MASQDVEAGRAYVTFYLRRTEYDRQKDELKRDAAKEEQGPQRPSHAMAAASSTEAGVSIPAELAEAAAKGAAGRMGAVTLSKMVPMFREIGTAATVAAPAVESVGTATAATATAATAAAPAIAATGTAATGASVGFAAMVTAALPVLIPLAAIAAAATAVYVALFKWDKLPFVVKALLLVLSPLVLACRAVVLAVKAVGLAISIVTAPFRLAAATVGLFYRAIVAIPAAIAALPGLLYRVSAAAVDMGVKIAKAAASMAAAVVRHVAAAAATLAKLPGQIAKSAAGAVEATSAAVRSLGMTIGKAGAVAAGLSAAVVGPLTAAAEKFAEYGKSVSDVATEHQVSAADAAVLMRAADATGQSIGSLAQQMADGSRDFSRWRTEVAASGMAMTGPGVASALALSRATDSLKESWRGLTMQLGSAVAPMIAETTQVITGAVRAVIRWVSEHKPLIAQVFRIASIVGTAAAAVTTLGGAIAGAGALLSPFTAALAAIAAGLAVVEYRTGAGRSLWQTYGDAVRRVYTTVVSYLGQMAAFVGRVVGGIKDALIAGDIAGAVNVLWSGAKVAWIAGLMELDSLTRGAFGGILANLAAGRWADAGEAVMAALKIAWLEGIGFLSSLWGRVVEAADTAWVGLQTGFDIALGGIEKGWLTMVELLKDALSGLLQWTIANVFRPLVGWLEENDTLFGIDSGIGEKARKGFGSLLDMQGALERSRKSPEQQAADQAAVDARTADAAAARENELLGRKAGRQSEMDAARIASEAEVTRLRQRQDELAARGTAAGSEQLAANQAALDQAIAAAAAARAAADAAKPQEEDYAVATEETEAGATPKGITRFSGEALAMSVGRSVDEPQKKIAKLSEEQLKEMRTIANELKLTLREVLKLQMLGGFA